MTTTQTDATETRNTYRNIITLYRSVHTPVLDKMLRAAATNEGAKFLSYGSNRAAAACAARIVRLALEGDTRYTEQAEEAIEWLGHYGCDSEGKAIATA